MDAKAAQSAKDQFILRIIITAIALVLLLWRLIDPYVGIDEPMIILLVLAVVPWIRFKTQTREATVPVGTSAPPEKIRQLEQKLTRLKQEVESLKLMALAMPKWECELLKRFGDEGDPIVQNIHSNFRKDIAALWGRGFVDHYSGEDLPEGADVAIKEHYRITPLGRDFLLILRQNESKLETGARS